MRTSKQLSVSLANKPGRLAAILAALSREKVHCVALSIMDGGERSTLRFVPDDYFAATEFLERHNVRFDTADVLLVPLSHQSGAFRKVCERLATEHLHIDHAYCSLNCSGGTKTTALAVVKVNDLVKAHRVLDGNGTTRRKQPGRRPVHAR